MKLFGMKFKFGDWGVVGTGYGLGITAVMLLKVGDVMTWTEALVGIGSALVGVTIGLVIGKYSVRRGHLRQGWREVDGMLMPPALADAYEKDQERSS